MLFKMVRIKERYLLVNIIYPHDSATATVPGFAHFHQPTSDDLTPQLLASSIKAEVARLFGEIGSGAINRSLNGQSSNACGKWRIRGV
jgi:ribonuclease P/MRP protein subunit POP5